MTTERAVWFVDVNGAEVEEVALERLADLLAELKDADEEHATVSVTDSEEWNLEISMDSVLLENVGVDGEEVGVLTLESVDDALPVAADFIAGDFSALRARPWSE